MKAIEKLIRIAPACALLFAPAFLMMSSGCAQRHRNPAPDLILLNEQRQQLLRELEAAEETDLSNARDPLASLVHKQDSFEQADKADRAIRELQSGYDVPQDELADALAVPPKDLTPEVKAELIRQLQGTIALNDRTEQDRLNNYLSDASVNTELYDAQKLFAGAVIKELNIGEDVRWDTIQKALQVVPQPN